MKTSTVGEALYWSYANLAMMANVLEDGLAEPVKKHFMIRSKLYAGLCKGTAQVRGFLDDEKLKLKLPRACWFCGSGEDLTIDHLIAQSKSGSHGGENLIFSCRACNSSKGATDLLIWFEKRGEFPPLYLLRRYLKIVIEYCKRNNLMELPFPVSEDAIKSMPVDINRIPHKFPPASQLRKYVPATV